jgi:hypothetical protein
MNVDCRQMRKSTVFIIGMPKLIYDIFFLSEFNISIFTKYLSEK